VHPATFGFQAQDYVNEQNSTYKKMNIRPFTTKKKMSNAKYFIKFSTKYPNPFNYFYSKIRLGTFTYDKSIEYMGYQKALADFIKNDFPRKKQLIKARRDWPL
ncbi:566_t:CDS:1, partial [Dentiscutata erythropus]